MDGYLFELEAQLMGGVGHLNLKDIAIGAHLIERYGSQRFAVPEAEPTRGIADR